MSSPPRSRRLAPEPLRTPSQQGSVSYRLMESLFRPRKVARILVVDDNASLANLMRELLTTRGYDVVTADCAENAEIEIRKQTPDLIISDVMMPGKSGYELCRDLKDNSATRLI